MKQTSLALTAALMLGLSACGGDPATPPAAPASPAETPAADTSDVVSTGSLQWAVSGDWRGEDGARDGSRNPVETLEFFGVEGDDTVVELWPGGGWYSRILAPYLAANGGTLIAATWDPNAFEGERRTGIEQRIDGYATAFNSNPDLFGTVQIAALSGVSGQLAEPGTADVVLTFRNIHNWMSGEYLDKVFADSFAALKPGGVMGVVEHRLPSAMEQDPVGASGYVHEDVVIAAAQRAGFVLEARSEINANPADTADHPYGVWTLPPVSRTQDNDGNALSDEDAARYAAIGESDRMTLKFVKPE